MQLIEKRLKSLSPELQKEVLDFIEFLNSKYSNSQAKKVKKNKSAGGSLSKYSNPKLQSKEKGAWAAAAAEKYANR
ncbi:MAG: DUF2281 domain-containing protein [Leptospiraceae bacterium]|jgi:hypothetical protein|nr:DUF2281 domain-containing protein [Leptospiraceae bacterium]